MVITDAIAENIPGYYSGTSGLLLPVPNKEFYPEEFREKSRLNYYGSLFNSIEVNNSFYKMPMAATVARWAADVPEGFRFTFKLNKELTHCKGLGFDAGLAAEFFRRISAASDKSGCVLVQFPGSIKPVYRMEVERLLSAISETNVGSIWNVCVEFRHQSWYTPETYELLEGYGMGMVLHDKLPAGGPSPQADTRAVYLRFHGPGGNYRGSYTDDFLYEYASYICEWLNEGKTVYSYFNNTMGSAIANLQLLRRAVSDGLC